MVGVVGIFSPTVTLTSRTRSIAGNPGCASEVFAEYVVSVCQYHAVNRMHVVSKHCSEVTECVIFHRHQLPVFGRQTVVEVFRVKSVIANNTVAPGTV